MNISLIILLRAVSLGHLLMLSLSRSLSHCLKYYVVLVSIEVEEIVVFSLIATGVGESDS